MDTPVHTKRQKCIVKFGDFENPEPVTFALVESHKEGVTQLIAMGFHFNEESEKWDNDVRKVWAEFMYVKDIHSAIRYMWNR